MSSTTVLTGNNIASLYQDGLWHMHLNGYQQDSRAGKVRRAPAPVVSDLTNPTRRVFWCPHRKPNPFFHLAEAIWMLAGRNDAAYLQQFAPTFNQFADDGTTLGGAYGHRWRSHFGHDQIRWAIDHLRNEPTSRRCVITMFDPRKEHADMELRLPKDVPCNTQIYFSSRTDAKDDLTLILDMTVMARSNDMVWGAYGSNVVHFSMLHELVARSVGFELGTMRTFSNDFHMYERHFHLMDHRIVDNPYESMIIRDTPAPYSEPLLTDGHDRRSGYVLEQMMKATRGESVSLPFLSDTYGPMIGAWKARKNKEWSTEWLKEVRGKDWRYAGALYLGIPLGEVGL